MPDRRRECGLVNGTTRTTCAVAAHRGTRLAVAVLALLATTPAVVAAPGALPASPQATPTSPPLPDLVAHLAAPPTARPGEDIGGRVRLAVTNVGAAVARGSRDHPNGFMVDLALGRDATVSVGFKVYSRKFSEDVLLEGGRVSRTTDLAPGARQDYPVGAVIPADAAPGAYHLCAFVDPGNVLPEANERNNATCVPLRVLPASQSGELANGAERTTRRRDP